MSRGSKSCESVPMEVRRAADLLERRWQISIIYASLNGVRRFNEFSAAIDGISPRMLTERLRELEDAGLLERRVLPTRPPSVEYLPTKQGARLRPLIEAMRDYADTLT